MERLRNAVNTCDVHTAAYSAFLLGQSFHRVFRHLPDTDELRPYFTKAQNQRAKLKAGRQRKDAKPRGGPSRQKP